MSLKVWLPLDGDLRNLGCSNYTITTVETTPTYVDGKIGKCYQRATTDTSSTNGISINNNLLDMLGTTASVALWVKPLGTHTHYEGAFISSGNWNTKRWAFGVNQTNTKVDILCGSYQQYIDCTVPVNQWTHLVSTYDNGLCKLYKNGIYIGELTGRAAFDSDATNTCIGRETYASGYFGFNGLINDVRIYDHCLSAAEVKEIAQGLILHYKLDDPYIEMPTFIDSTINTTAYNSAIGKYGYNETSNLAKTTGFFQGKNCIKISTITEGQNAQPYSYFSNLFTSNGANAPAYKALSFDYFTTCPTTTWLNIYKLGSGTGTATWKTTNSTGMHSGVYTNSSNSILVAPNEWNHVEVIFHGTTDANAEWGYCINGPTHTSNLNYYFLFANIQLEENDHVTGYGANMHESIITDSSGYGHNGEVISELHISNDTARYSFSTSFDGTDDCIIVPYNQICPENIFTINLWFKKDALGTKNYETLFGGPSGFEMDTRNGSSTSLTLYMTSTRGGKRNLITSLSLGEWYMITMTRDGTTERYYVNGIFQSEIEAKSMPNGVYRIGAWASNDKQNYYGLISDFRIYCTPLLDTDIKLLYNMGSRIDNFGGVHSFEIEETPQNKITKTGILKNNAIESYLTLPDNSYWKLILYHYVDNGNNLFTSSNATDCNDFGLYSKLKYINNYTYNGKYEFYVIQDGKEFRWTQTSQPTASSITGLTVVEGYNNPVHGLAKASQSNTYIGYGSWWGACGCWTKYSTSGKTGIPGFGPGSAEGICEKYLALYARIEKNNISFTNGFVEATEFIEI